MSKSVGGVTVPAFSQRSPVFGNFTSSIQRMQPLAIFSMTNPLKLCKLFTLNLPKEHKWEKLYKGLEINN